MYRIASWGCDKKYMKEPIHIAWQERSCDPIDSQHRLILFILKENALKIILFYLTKQDLYL